jgi:outer membrane protein TolC
MKQILFIFLLISFFPCAYAQQKDLNYYLQQALQNSPLLMDYQNQVRSNLIDSMRIRASRGIQLEALSTGTYAPIINGWGYDEAITNIADFSAAMSLSKEIRGKHNLQNQYNSLYYQNRAIRNSQHISTLDLKKQVTAQYIEVYGDYLSIQSNAEVLRILQQQEIFLKALTENGNFKQTEYLSLLVTLNQQEITVDQNRSQYKTDLAMLNLLCGIWDTSCQPLSDPDLQVDSQFEIRRTIFYHQFITDSLQLDIQNKQIDFDYQPKFSLFADGGYHSSFAVDPLKNIGASAGFSFTVPIYDGSQRRMQHDKLTIAEQTRAGYTAFYTQQYDQQVDILMQQLQWLNEIRIKAEKQVGYSRTLVDAYQKLINTGEISITEYVVAINNWIDANRFLTEKRLSTYRIINELNYWSSEK